jgi:hypothetical protein
LLVEIPSAGNPQALANPAPGIDAAIYSFHRQQLVILKR